MSNQSDRDIEGVVFKVLENVLLKRRDDFKRTDKLIKDLKMDSDDFSFLFVPQLEQQLRIKVPIKEWSVIQTIEDVICLLEKYS